MLGIWSEELFRKCVLVQSIHFNPSSQLVFTHIFCDVVLIDKSLSLGFARASMPFPEATATRPVNTCERKAPTRWLHVHVCLLHVCLPSELRASL